MVLQSKKVKNQLAFRGQKVCSMAGLYSRRKDKGEYYYCYTELTTRANSILKYVHTTTKSECLVFIAKDDEQAWLKKDLNQKDVLELCQPSHDPGVAWMRFLLPLIPPVFLPY